MSLSESDDGKVLVHCYAGCDQMEVIQALKDMGLWPSQANTSGTDPSRPPRGELVEAYSYLDEAGKLRYQSCRFIPKIFRLRKPIGQGDWEYNLKGVDRIPYNLPDVIGSEVVFIAEGEKDCNNLKKVGISATTNPMGALKWRKEYNRYFENKQVVILPDNDEPGRKHADSVARHLHGVAASVKILELPNLPEKGDVSDWLAAGGTAEELRKLAEKAPEWQQAAKVGPQKENGSKGSRASGILRPVDPDEKPELPPVNATLPNAPVLKNITIPAGWSLTPEGVGKIIKIKEGLEHRLVAPAPIMIAGRLVDQVDDTEFLKLTWLRDGRWKEQTISRKVIATTRAITELAEVGLPVTSKNAGDLVEFLAAFEAENIGMLPLARVSPHLGWQGEAGNLEFLWGKTLLRPGLDRQAIDLEMLPTKQWQRDVVTFRGTDLGDEQIAAAFCSQGSFEGWVQAVKLVADYPRVMLGLYGALTPPLLEIFGCPNFILDWSCRSSVGKTSLLRGGGSCWGNPDEQADASVIASWDATRVWINRAAVTLHSLPLFLDETKRVKYPAEIGRILYDIAQGRDRGRGSKMGTRRSDTFRTVLLSTGETPAVSFTNDGGTRARVLTLWGHPFGKADQETAKLVNTLNLAVKQNYGHAGPLFVQFLLSHQSDWEMWRKKYYAVNAAYQDMAGANPVASRLCAYFSALNLTAAIAHAALDLPWTYQDPVEALWEDLVSETDTADVASQALAMVVSWARAHETSFSGRERDGRPSFQGWAGRWDPGESWEYIAFLPHQLKALIKEFGFDFEAVTRSWLDSGWLEVDRGPRKTRQKQIRINGEKTGAYVIRRSAIKALESE
ncbi:MAG: DUF927 domain-containing protein [Thermodesulfobacteriota bacterium]